VPDPDVRGGGRLLPWLVAALSLAVGITIVRPFVDVPVAFDTQATVAYFDRIVAGAHLEQALSTTPKPFLTIVDGTVHWLTGDWRAIVWLTLAVQAAAAGLAVVLAGRAAERTAGAAAGLVIGGTPLLIEDAALGLAVAWALLGWLAAALLLSGPRPRPGLAGIVLGLAALCRLETLVIVGVLAVALAWVSLGPWPSAVPRPAVPRRYWLAAVIPFAALPAMLGHDWLLTGDPLFWARVSQRYSDAVRASRNVLDPIERISWFIRRYAHLWPAVLLGIVGLVDLIRRRRWGALVGLTGMGPGIGAFIVLLAARGLYAPERYALPIDLSLFLLAAFGFGRLVDLAADRVGSSGAARRLIVGGAFGIVLVGAGLARFGPFEPGTVAVITDLRTLNENVARVEPILRQRMPHGASGRAIDWIVPTAVRPRVAVDLDVPLTVVSGLSLAWLDASSGLLEDGQVIVHDRRGDLPAGQFGVLETGLDAIVGNHALRPLLADPSGGVWVFEVTARR
jgi:hypothetical protein